MRNDMDMLALATNTGSLYVTRAEESGFFVFASEQFFLSEFLKKNTFNLKTQDVEVEQIKAGSGCFVRAYDANVRIFEIEGPDIPNLYARKPITIKDSSERLDKIERCTSCVTPASYPFITFDDEGVCDKCREFVSQKPLGMDRLLEELAKYKSTDGSPDCIVAFSGGRDSSYGLHVIKNKLGMNPIAFTYDWGMVTDLGRRNISRMSAKLGVENIIIAADIALKRENIKKNIQAWMKSPHLGMVNLFTAGDKHFFQHVETVKKQTGIDLNLWGLNPLETTHFKTGFLGIPPYFDERTVYSTGLQKQIRYQSTRFREFLRNPSYFNSSIFDSLSGEFFRSIKKKRDYFHIYDYWKWDEDIIEKTLLDEYDWEMAPDTVTSWRIGDGTAAFYNYIFYTVAGFTEHDTFRSNQIREGQISRDEALQSVREENKPRYQNIRWYLDTIGLDFSETVEVINEMPKIWRSNQ